MPNNADITLHNSMLVVNFFEDSISNDSKFMLETLNTAAAKNILKEKKKSENISKSITEHLYFIQNGEFKDSPLAPSSTTDNVSQSSSVSVQAADGTVGASVGVKTGSSAQASIDEFISDIKTSVNETFSDIETTKQAFIDAYSPPDDEVERRKDLPKAWDLIGESLKKDLNGVEYKSLKDRLKNGLLEECIPCKGRLDALADIDIFGDFLDALEADILARLRELQALFDALFRPPDSFDLCKLINFFSFMCIPDLYGMLTFLLGYYNSFLIHAMGLPGDAMAALMGLIATILSPMLLFLDGLFDELLALILAPINCVIDAFRSIVNKFPAGFSANKGVIGVSRADFRAEGIKTDIRNVFNPVALAREANTDFSKIQTIENNSQNISPAQGTHSPSSGGRVSQNFSAINKSISQAVPIPSTIRNTLDMTERAIASILVARNWVNDYILKGKEKLFALLKQDAKSTANVNSAIALGMDIYMLTSLIKTIIDLVRDGGLKCDGSNGDTSNVLEQLVEGGGGGFINIVDIGSDSIFNDNPGNDQGDSGLALVPAGFLGDDIKIDNGDLYVEEDVPGFGKMRIPVSIIKSCKQKADLEDNAILQKWMNDVLASKSA